MSNVTLTLTIEQAAAMTRMLDLATRIHLCQFGEIGMLATMGSIKHQSGRQLDIKECDDLRPLIAGVKNTFGFASNSSFGIGSPHVCTDAHRGYEIKKVVEQALAEHREPNPTGWRGVDYDGLIVRYTTDPAPVATVSAPPAV